MAIANVKVTLPCPIDIVWETVTDLSSQLWRSEIDRVEVIDDINFIEHTKDGFATNFTTTTKEHHKLWAFSLENKNVVGNWTGEFYEHGDTTTLVFTENIKVKNILLTPFIGAYLRKQQRQYFVDLKKKLQC